MTELFQSTSAIFYAKIILRVVAFLVFYLWLRRLVERKNSVFFALPFAAIAVIALTVADAWVTNEPLLYLIVLVLTTVLVMIFLYPGMEDSAMAGLFFSFQVMICKAIVVGVFSLYVNQNMYQVLQVANYVQITSLLMWVLLVALFLIFSSFVSVERFSKLRHTSGQKYSLLIMQSILALFMIFTSYNYYYNMEMIWFSVSQVLTACLMEGVYCVFLHYAMENSAILHVDVKRREHQRLAETRKGRYAYHELQKKHMAVVKEEIRNVGLQALQSVRQENLVQADSQLQHLQQIVERKTPADVTYSNYKEADALLLDYYSTCISQHITFDGQMSLPENVSTELLQHVIDFTEGMIDYALLQTKRISSQGLERTITVRSSYQNGWIIVSVTSPVIGTIHIQNGLVKGSITQKELKESIQDVGGIYEVELDGKTLHQSLRQYTQGD